MNIVNNNPYRILGVYANSRRQEILASKGKATAFLRVGKPIDYPLDLNGVLPSISRTIEILNEAESHLSIAKEQIKYTQFWFLQVTPLDETALIYLGIGQIDSAIMIWSKPNNVSGLQNKMVCLLIKGDISSAVLIAEKLYTQYGDTYIKTVDPNSTLQMSGTDLLHQFLDSLGEEIGISTLLEFVSSEESKSYVSSKTIGPLISKISSEVERTKRVDHKSAQARIEAARILVKNTREPFAQLKSILQNTDSQLQMIADKLGLEILQCGIDYFNNSEDVDAPHIAMKMQKYANTIVIGKLAKQRCEENIRILQKVIEELPPKEVVRDNNAIMSRIEVFSKSRKNSYNAVLLLKDTTSYLQNIKNILGAKDEYYLKISTLVVSQALHGVVVEVNASQKPVQSDLSYMAYELSPNLLTPEQKLNLLERIKKALQNAWDAIEIMDGFDIDSDYKQHYYQNRNAIRSMCKQFGIETSWEPLPAGGFSEYGGFWNYIKSSRSTRWQAALIVQILSLAISYWLYTNNNSYYKAVNEYILWGLGIGACAWICVVIDNEERDFRMPNIERGGCGAVIALIGLFVFYWIYKAIRLAIDGIKDA